MYTGAVADEWLKQSLEVAACSDKANITSLFVPTHQEEQVIIGPQGTMRVVCVLTPAVLVWRTHQGRYCVRLFKQGEWVLVDIDDRLPCDGLGHRVFMKCRDGSVFWASLLEKAAAKLHGCYKALTGGVMREGLEDVTGGVCAAVPMVSEASVVCVHCDHGNPLTPLSLFRSLWVPPTAPLQEEVCSTAQDYLLSSL